MQIFKLNNTPNSTNRSLLQAHNELETWRSSMLYKFLKPRIDAFYKDNGVKLEAIEEKFEMLSRKYFEYEIVEDKPRVKMHDVEGKMVEVLVEGKTKEEYVTELDEFLNTECYIKV